MGANHIFVQCSLFRNDSPFCVVDNLSDESNLKQFYVHLANRGPDSRFKLEASLKTLCPRLSRSSIMNMKNHDQSKHEYKPGSKSLDYHRSYTNIDSHKDIFERVSTNRPN